MTSYTRCENECAMLKSSLSTIKMQSNPASPPSVASPDGNVYENIEALLERAVEEMGNLRHIHHTQCRIFSPGSVYTLKSIWISIRPLWENLLEESTERDSVSLLLSEHGTLSSPKKVLEDRFDASVERGRKCLEQIKDELKKHLADDLSQGVRRLLLTFDQILLSWTILHYPDEGCSLLILERSSTTRAETITEFHYPTAELDMTDTMDDSSLTTQHLPVFSSLEEFSDFCCSLEEERVSSRCRE